jgi:GNAT superfamily N-acetyltransferase
MKHEIGKSFIKYSKENGEIVVDELFVSPDQKGGKLGYALLDIARDFAELQKMNLALYAEVQSGYMDNDVLVEYYRKYGFESHPNSDQLMIYNT